MKIAILDSKTSHQLEIERFLKENISNLHWEFTHPQGHGNETYIVCGGRESLFIKLGSPISRYKSLASIGLAPTIIKDGTLEDGTTIMVQEFISGRTPTRHDYRNHIEDFANAINKIHHCDEIKKTLPKPENDQFSTIGTSVLNDIDKRWNKYNHLVPDSADFVDQGINQLREEVYQFTGSGLVASHNDICNSNWIITPQGTLYLLDLDSMSFDDPALDIGATLWWYYSPDLREEFLNIVGYSNNDAFKKRMHIRMAMHCLNIILPRENSFDSFHADEFVDNLADFKAIMNGEDNPQGYYD